MKNFSEKTLLLIFILSGALFFSLAFIGGYLFDNWQESVNNPFPILNESYSILKENALADLPAGKALEYGMIRGMLEAYKDPYTVFVEAPQQELQTEQLQGKFGGIGVRLERDPQNNYLLYPLPDSPAATAGIKDGDRLDGVDTLQVNPDTTMETVEAAIRGPENSKVKITMMRFAEQKSIAVFIQRKEIALPSVTYNLVPGVQSVGVVQIHIIADTTPAEVSRAIQSLGNQGSTAIVLDLRDNGGGMVDSGVSVARLFLSGGVIMQQHYRGKPIETILVGTPGPFVNLPLSILVNKNTANAAEIIAGALQTQKRAKLVGTPTYGKNTMQLIFELQDKSSLHVTTANWWIPGLPPFTPERGLIPDILLSEKEIDQPNALQQAATNLLK